MPIKEYPIQLKIVERISHKGEKNESGKRRIGEGEYPGTWNLKIPGSPIPRFILYPRRDSHETVTLVGAYGRTPLPA